MTRLIIIDWEKVWRVFDAWIEKRTDHGLSFLAWSAQQRKIRELVRLQTTAKIDWRAVWKANLKWYDRTCGEWDRQKKNISSLVNKQL